MKIEGHEVIWIEGAPFVLGTLMKERTRVGNNRTTITFDVIGLEVPIKQVELIVFADGSLRWQHKEISE